MNTLVKHINKMVGMFLQNNADAANQEELWMSPENQKQVKSVLTRANNKAVVKDPNAPKRAKSAYLFFCDDNRDKVKKQLGKDAKATDVTKELGAQWNKLKVDKKQRKKLADYQKKADADKSRYQEEKEKYTPPAHLMQPEKTGPKRAKSAYLFFCGENRDKVKKQLGKDAKATDVTKELGAQWNKLKEKNGTAPYEKMAAKDQERYLKEKEEMSGEEAVDEKVETKTEVVVETEVVETKKKKAPKKGSKK